MATRPYVFLELNSGSTYNIDAGDTVTIETYRAGDWDGAIITSTGTWYLVMPAGVVVTGLNITNCDASGGEEIDVSDGTSTDGGGNVNFKWPVVGGGGVFFFSQDK